MQIAITTTTSSNNKIVINTHKHSKNYEKLHKLALLCMSTGGSRGQICCSVDAVEAICFVSLLSIDHSGGTHPGLGAHPKR